MKRVSSSSTVPTSKKMCLISSSDEPPITMHSLPSHMFHLGDENFATVGSFLGHTRVHVRKYSTDERGILHPTKDGVSLSPIVWEALNFQLDSFSRFEGNEHVLIVKKDVCVSKQRVDDEVLIAFQRMFQKRNGAFQFVPESVLLTVEQVRKLNDHSDAIQAMVKRKLITYSLQYFVQKQLETSTHNPNGYSGDPDKPEGLSELIESLCKCLKNFIYSKIMDLFECFGCDVGYNNQVGHDCMTMSDADKFTMYFDKALYSLNWHEIAKDFVQQNVNNTNFRRLIIADDFFDIVDTSDLFKSVESLYVKGSDIPCFDL